METIGDAYMVVSGVPERSKYHAEHVADLALDMISAMPTLVDPSKSSPHLKIRIGNKSLSLTRDFELVYQPIGLSKDGKGYPANKYCQNLLSY